MVLVYELCFLDMKFDLSVFAPCHSDVYLVQLVNAFGHG